MTKNALTYLVEQAEKSRNSAGIVLAKSRIAEQQIDQQVVTLREYRKEYYLRMCKAMSRGAALQLVRDYQQFLASLDEAIMNAEGYLAKQQEKVAISMDDMNKRQRELSSMGTLAKRRQASEQQAQEKIENKEQDAMATRVYLRNSTAGSLNSSLSE